MPDATLARLLQPTLAHPSALHPPTTKSASPSTSLISSNATSRLSHHCFTTCLSIQILPVDVRSSRNSTIFAIFMLKPSPESNPALRYPFDARKCRSSSSSSGVPVIKTIAVGWRWFAGASLAQLITIFARFINIHHGAYVISPGRIPLAHNAGINFSAALFFRCPPYGKGE